MHVSFTPVTVAYYSYCVYLTPCNDCIFQAHFLHVINFLYNGSVLQMSSVINFSSWLRMAGSCDFGKLLTGCKLGSYFRQYRHFPNR